MSNLIGIFLIWVGVIAYLPSAIDEGPAKRHISNDADLIGIADTTAQDRQIPVNHAPVPSAIDRERSNSLTRRNGAIDGGGFGGNVNYFGPRKHFTNCYSGERDIFSYGMSDIDYAEFNCKRFIFTSTSDFYVSNNDFWPELKNEGFVGEFNSLIGRPTGFFGFHQSTPDQDSANSGNSGSYESYPRLEIGKYDCGFSGGRCDLLGYQVPLFAAFGFVFAAFCAYFILWILDNPNGHRIDRVLACVLSLFSLFCGGTSWGIAAGFWPAWIVRLVHG